MHTLAANLTNSRLRLPSWMLEREAHTAGGVKIENDTNMKKEQEIILSSTCLDNDQMVNFFLSFNFRMNN